jgi:hypothetical protein
MIIASIKMTHKTNRKQIENNEKIYKIHLLTKKSQINDK